MIYESQVKKYEILFLFTELYVAKLFPQAFLNIVLYVKTDRLAATCGKECQC
jgi:hypothetical protein